MPKPTLAESQPRARAKVLLPMPVGDGYDYEVPDGMGVEPGDIVTVPLGPRQMTGVIWHDAP
ncbi:MAG: hypothetical protein AAGA39_10155, partial [Pseudomonadota bacterium]